MIQNQLATALSAESKVFRRKLRMAKLRRGRTSRSVFDWHGDTPIELLSGAERAGHRVSSVCPSYSAFTIVRANFRAVLVASKSCLQLLSVESRRHVQQQCQQQLNHRPEGREAAPARGQYPEDQGTNPSAPTHKHGRPTVEWRRRFYCRNDTYIVGLQSHIRHKVGANKFLPWLNHSYTQTHCLLWKRESTSECHPIAKSDVSKRISQH